MCKHLGRTWFFWVECGSCPASYDCCVERPDTESPPHRGSGMTSVLCSVEVKLAEQLPASLIVPSIVFLNTRQAMIFINTALGTQRSARIFVGSDWLNTMITAKRFTVTVALWKERPRNWLSMRHEVREVLTSSMPVRFVKMPWRISASNHQRPRLGSCSWVWDERKNYGTSAMIWQEKQEYRGPRERQWLSLHITWLVFRCSILLIQHSLNHLQQWQARMWPQQIATTPRKKQLSMGFYRIRLGFGRRKGELWKGHRDRRGCLWILKARNTN